MLDSNQRRLSRRFYRPLRLATRATCHGGGRPDSNRHPLGPQPSAIAFQPRPPCGSWHGLPPLHTAGVISPVCSSLWAQKGSNHRLLLCESSALPLSYAPQRLTSGRCEPPGGITPFRDVTALVSQPARSKGLEPPLSCSVGSCPIRWATSACLAWAALGSNQWPPACRAGALPLRQPPWPDSNQAGTVWIVLVGIIIAFAAGLVVSLRLGRRWGFMNLGAFELCDRINRARFGGRRRN